MGGWVGGWIVECLGLVPYWHRYACVHLSPNHPPTHLPTFGVPIQGSMDGQFLHKRMGGWVVDVYVCGYIGNERRIELLFKVVGECSGARPDFQENDWGRRGGGGGGGRGGGGGGGVGGEEGLGPVREVGGERLYVLSRPEIPDTFLWLGGWVGGLA